MWTVIFITCNKNTVDKLRKLFRENSIMVRTRPVKNDDSRDESCYEVLVPYTEIGIAQDMIIEEEIS